MRLVCTHFQSAPAPKVDLEPDDAPMEEGPITDSLEDEVSAGNSDYTSASMTTDSQTQADIAADGQRADPLQHNRRWNPAMAHTKVFDSGADPAGKTDGDAALSTPTQCQHDAALMANIRSADEIVHAMRLHPSTPTNALLKSMLAIVPPHIESQLRQVDGAAKRYTLTWMSDNSKVTRLWRFAFTLARYAYNQDII